jgi:hypothetical protein
MGFRGRNWTKRLKSAKKSLEIKKKATKEQWGKIKIGAIGFFEIKKRMKDEKKLYEKTGNMINKDKYERLESIVSCLKRMDIKEAKKLALEYDKLYPNDF